MKKEEFIKLGIDEEAAKKCESASLEELKGYVPYERFKEMVDEKNTLKTTLTERDKQLDTLKNATGDVEAMKKQIETLQADNKTKDEAHETEIKQLKINNAIDKALTSAKAKNLLAAKALLKDIDKAELLEDGTIKGLDEQIKALQKSDGYLFEETSTKTHIKGAEPSINGNGDKGVDVSKMTYSELAAYMAENPNTTID